MGFFIQNQKGERILERLVLLFYSAYNINLCVGSVRKGAAAWVVALMIGTALSSWICFCTKYKTFRVRAAFTTVMIQVAVILYAVQLEDMQPLIPVFMVLVLLVSLYGMVELLWFTVASAVFVVFYHAVVIDTFALASRERVLLLLPQAVNIFCMEIVLYIWLKKRNETSDQMYEIIEALMEAEQSKDDFLANVSHEIRTPVNTICGMSEMALRERDPEKMRDEVFDIRDAGHNLMSLVSDILDFAQLQQGKMNLEEEAYNLTSTVNDIINMAMARKGGKQIELIVDSDAGIPSGLLGDEKKIRRVIMNLVDNAIKFTNEGGVIIHISFRKENYGVNLCISVKDTGIGISEASMEKLFESFSQVDTRRNRQEGGVGLGLAISKALVQKMGGTITVRSRLGKGSEFRFVVPQKVLDEKPIGRIENREKLNVAAYFDMEQFDMMTIRDEYSSLIVHMVKQLQVKCHICRNLAELKRREGYEPFSHVFISLEEYQEDEAYFDELAGRAEVIMVIDRPREKYVSNPDIVRLYKPFHILPVISILNGSRDSEGGRQLVRQSKFTAPGVHALVVDDNRTNIRVVEGLLKEYQITVSYAVNGHEALEMIEAMSYDFVFMDHMMPEMDGIEVMHRIRDKAGNYYQRVPIIALTANAAPGNREMFLEEGFNDFVAKPVEISVLERVLRRNLPEEKLVFEQKKIDWEEQETGKNNGKNKDKDKSGDKDKSDVKGKSGDKGKSEDKDKSEDGGGNLVIGSLDTHKGLLYCGGEKAYLAVLEACCREGAEDRLLLDGLFQKQDWQSYVIKVHALKSSMQNIGAIPLSEKARALEMAGKKGDIPFILENHGDMLAEYVRVMEELAQCPLLHSGLPEEPSAGSSPEQDNGGQDDHPELPELEEEAFDKLMEELENAMYSLDSGQMLAVLSEMQEYQYCGAALKEKLLPIRKKVEMSDYMSAVDAVSQIREDLRNAKDGGAVR